jgi:hypothetical protein
MRVRSATPKAHPWKLMMLGAVVFATAFPLMLAQQWYLPAVMSLIALGVLGIQWLTVDPPYVDESDLYGPDTKE